jgi:hypothetical protein
MIKNKDYWAANGTYYENKLEAILAAQNTGTDITFHYNDEYWDCADWSVEPTESLEDLYLKRAQSLRDRYKTLILRFSGGADSMNILRTCVDNNIKIDVIVTNTYVDHINADPSTHPACLEKINIVYPFLDELEQQGVEFTRLNIDNSWCFNLVEDPDWIFKINAPRFRLVEIQSPRTVLHPALAQYNSADTCIISGLDKPRVNYEHGKIWYYSMPDLYSCQSHPRLNDIVQEPFYSTADMPELIIKQCHVVKQYAQNNPELLAQWDNHTFNQRKEFLVPILYPKYFDFAPGATLPYYHVSVAGNHGPWDNIVDFDYNKNPAVYQGHQQGIDLVDRLVEQRFKSKGDTIRNDGLVRFYTKRRWLGR